MPESTPQERACEHALSDGSLEGSVPESKPQERACEHAWMNGPWRESAGEYAAAACLRVRTVEDGA